MTPTIEAELERALLALYALEDALDGARDRELGDFELELVRRVARRLHGDTVPKLARATARSAAS